MGKFDIYNVSLKGNQEDLREIEFLLDNDFFKKIDGNEVQKGKLKVLLVVKKTLTSFEFDFNISGLVFVPCDRCLDEMEIEVETKETLYVKLGKEFSEENDNIIIIPEEEGVINVAWFLYEFVALCIPMKHVHGPGKCNKTMTSKLKKHITRSADDDEDSSIDFGDIEEDEIDPSPIETDPRWDELKKIIDNN